MSRFHSSLLILFLFLLILSSFYPALVSSRAYQALSKTETAGIFRLVRNFLREEQIVSFSQPANLTQQGATAITMYAVYQEMMQFYFQELPKEISKKVLLETVKLGYHLLNSSDTAYTLLDTLEGLSVKRANQIAREWFTQNEIKAAGGEISFSYLDHQGKNQSGYFQYIILYHPQTVNQGKIIAAFYSPEELIPTDSREYIPWPYQAWRQAGYQHLDPFIVEIVGQVEKNYSAYGWVNQPSLAVTFPSFVPQFSFGQESTGFLSSLSWLKDQVVNFFTPLASPQEVVINPPPTSSSEIEDLSRTVQSLKEIIGEQSVKDHSSAGTTQENGQNIELAEVMEELTAVFLNRDQESTELMNLIKEVVQSQAKIAEIQAQQVKSATSSAEKNTEMEEKTETETLSETQSAETLDSSLCSTDYLSQPTWDKVVLNEIAWMGTSLSSNNEWLELKNISSQSANLNGWQLFNQNQHLIIRFNENDILSPNQFFLLERSDDQSLPYQKADKIYQGGIKNTEETLYLFDSHCQLQDIAGADPDWPAGDNASKRTMERKENLGWQTSYSVGGTPNQRNSQGWQLSSNSSTNQSANQTTPVDNYPPLAVAGPDQTIEFGQSIILDASQSGDNVGIVSYKWDTTQDGLWNFTEEESALVLEKGLAPGNHLITLQVADAAGQTDEDEVLITVLEIPKILISEVQISGENSQDEFIELFNPNQREVNLSRWSLKKKTASGTEMNLVSSQNFEGRIPPQSYFLITPPEIDATHGYRGTISPDIYYSSQSNSIADNNTILFYNPLSQLADKLGFGQGITDFEGEAFPENPAAGLSLGRRWNGESQLYPDTDNNKENFEIGIPTPKSRNQSYQGPVFPAVSFSLSDLETGSLTTTTQSAVEVTIIQDEEAEAWFLSESQAAPPEKDDSCWLAEKPDKFILSSGNGEKTVSLWLQDKNGLPSPQYSASIILNNDPPQAVYDLSLYPTRENGEILLTWTAPQKAEGAPVSHYSIKQSFQAITEDKWEEASLVSQDLLPQDPGQPERLVVSNLDSSLTYYFALKSQDEWEALSPVSNSPARQAIAASGTPTDPYIITGCRELQDISLNLNASYQLVNDIDCSATIDWNGQLGFDPLGDSSLPFTGSLDGAGHTIDNLHINRTGSNYTGETTGWYVGLIGRAKAGAQLSQLGLRNADLRGYQYVGGLVGYIQGYTNDALPIEITDCYTTGYLASSYNTPGGGYVGGLVGSAANAWIDHSWSSMEVEASQADGVGGLIGITNVQGMVINSHYQGTVRGGQIVGGLIGGLNGITVQKCWTQGEVKGEAKIGGFAGEIAGSAVENSYSQAKVSATNNLAGGFAYSSNSKGLYYNYAAGYVSGPNINKAGFLQKRGYSSRETDCYWDIQTTGQSQSEGTAIGLTTGQMQNQTNFSNWDFNSIWTIEAGDYPRLRE